MPIVMEKDGFEIHFDAEEEFESFEHSFSDCYTPRQIAAYRRSIDNGTSAYFTAKVSAWKAGIELGADYLGCCHYKSTEEFCVKYKDDYFADMVDAAILEAKPALEEMRRAICA